MPDPWPVGMLGRDKPPVVDLARRFAALGLPHAYADVFRFAVFLALAAPDELLAATVQRYRDGQEVASCTGGSGPSPASGSGG
jgi:hypothetical protein